MTDVYSIPFTSVYEFHTKAIKMKLRKSGFECHLHLCNPPAPTRDNALRRGARH